MSKVAVYINNVYSKIIGLEDEKLIKKIKKACSYNYKVWQNRKLKYFRNYLFSEETHKFHSGLLYRVIKTLKKNNIKYEIFDLRKKSTKKLFPYNDEKIDSIFDFNNTDEVVPIDFSLSVTKQEAIEARRKLRDYQLKAVKNSLKYGRGLLSIGMRGGKTEIAFSIVYELNIFPVLFLVHTKELLNQTYDRMPFYLKGQTGRIGDSVFEPNKKVIIATIQSLYRKRKTPEIKKLLEETQMVIIDEAHRAAGNSYQKILKQLKNCYYRFGLTGTSWRNDEKTLKLTAQLGRVIFKYTLQDLEKDGILNKCKVIFIHENESLLFRKGWKAIYERGIVLNSRRNKKVIEKTLEQVQQNKITLILVKSIKHGELLEKRLLKEKVKVKFESGKSSSKERAKVLKEFQKGKWDVLIGTSIYYEGVNFTGLTIPKKGKCLIIAGGGCSRIESAQKFARMLTPEKKYQMGETIIYDFMDKQHKILEKHSLARKAIYEKQGYKAEEELPF